MCGVTGVGRGVFEGGNCGLSHPSVPGVEPPEVGSRFDGAGKVPGVGAFGNDDQVVELLPSYMVSEDGVLACEPDHSLPSFPHVLERFSYLAVKPSSPSGRFRAQKAGLACSKGCVLEGLHGFVELFWGFQLGGDWCSFGEFGDESRRPILEELILERVPASFVREGGVGDGGYERVVIRSVGEMLRNR